MSQETEQINDYNDELAHETTPGESLSSINESLNTCIEELEKGTTTTTTTVESLSTLQQRVASAGLFSKNESLEDVVTSYLPALTLDYYLAMALLGLPMRGGAKERHVNVTRAVDLLFGCLGRLEEYSALPSQVQKEYLELVGSDGSESSSNNSMNHLFSRDAKIDRFRRQRATEEEWKKLQALRQRRIRLGADPNEDIDGYDDDGLQRTLGIANMHRCAGNAVEEILGAQRELEMLAMAVQREAQREREESHTSNGNNNSSSPRAATTTPLTTAQKPLQVTRITQDADTGQLVFRRDEIQSQVFRPSWNQPTMSLDQLADIEVAQAREREASQKQAAVEARHQPRRYDQLVQDGMEDDSDLVDQSAVLDRRWDDFREENPRGSGNKMTDRGDRNF